MVKSAILLSGGLDSLVSLGLKKEELNVSLALTFNSFSLCIFNSFSSCSL